MASTETQFQGARLGNSPGGQLVHQAGLVPIGHIATWVSEGLLGDGGSLAQGTVVDIGDLGYAVQISDSGNFLVFFAPGAVSVTLPDPATLPGEGWTLGLKSQGAGNSVIITPLGGRSIDGFPAKTISNGIAVQLYGDGFDYYTAASAPVTPIPGNGSAVLLARLLAAGFNSVLDQPFEMLIDPASRYRIREITAANPAGPVDVAVGGIYTAANKGGTAIVAGTQEYGALLSPDTALDLMLVPTPANTVWGAGTRLYFSLGTPQGAAVTADLYVYGPVY